jgi:hypothetical protein
LASGEQLHVGLARLLEHEGAHRHLAALERLVEGDLPRQRAA